MSYNELESITGKHRQRVIASTRELESHRWVARSLLSPFFRFQDVPRPWGWAWSSLVSLVVNSMFGSLMLLLVATGIIDYIAGAYVAARQGRWSAEIARAGFVGKSMGYALLLLVFGAEFWMMKHLPQAPDTNGYVATFLAMCLLTVDLQSIEKHRTALGFGPIPGLSHVLGWLRGVLSARIPQPPPSVGPSVNGAMEDRGVLGGDLPSVFDKPKHTNGGGG